MHVQAALSRRARLPYALLLAGIIAVSLALGAFIAVGPAPERNGVDANPFSGAPFGAGFDVLPRLHSALHDGASVASAHAAPRSALDTSGTFAPAATDVPATRTIERVDVEGWDDVSAGNVSRAIALLPASVQTALGNPALGPVRILINVEGRTSSGSQPYGQAANFFSTNEGRNEVVLYPQQSVFTIVHELGHAYNLRNLPAGNYAWVLLQPEMQSFMAVSGWQVLTPPEQIAGLYDHSQVGFSYTGASIWTSLSRNDPLEDFANSFADYFVAPDDLAARSPERFAWFAARFP